MLPALRDLTFCPSPSADLLEILDSKTKTEDFFGVHGIRVIRQKMSAPCFAKPDRGSASRGIRLLQSDVEMDQFKSQNLAEEFIFQEVMSGPEYSVDGYSCVNSSGCYLVARERVEVSGGEITVGKIISNTEFEETARAVAVVGGLSGPFTLQFMWDQDQQEFCLMEVNARFGGGLPMSNLSGMPWMEIVLRDYLKLPQIPTPVIREILVKRTYQEHFFDS